MSTAIAILFFSCYHSKVRRARSSNQNALFLLASILGLQIFPCFALSLCSHHESTSHILPVCCLQSCSPCQTSMQDHKVFSYGALPSSPSRHYLKVWDIGSPLNPSSCMGGLASVCQDQPVILGLSREPPHAVRTLANPWDLLACAVEVDRCLTPALPLAPGYRKEH